MIIIFKYEQLLCLQYKHNNTRLSSMRLFINSFLFFLFTYKKKNTVYEIFGEKIKKESAQPCLLKYKDKF